jgi:hypothetical protein
MPQLKNWLNKPTEIDLNGHVYSGHVALAKPNYRTKREGARRGGYVFMTDDDQKIKLHSTDLFAVGHKRLVSRGLYDYEPQKEQKSSSENPVENRPFLEIFAELVLFQSRT